MASPCSATTYCMAANENDYLLNKAFRAGMGVIPLGAASSSLTWPHGGQFGRHLRSWSDDQWLERHRQCGCHPGHGRNSSRDRSRRCSRLEVHSPTPGNARCPMFSNQVVGPATKKAVISLEISAPLVVNWNREMFL